MTLGDRIKNKREQMGISQIELANKVGISKQTLYKYENNIVTNIPSDKIEAIAKYLDVSPGFLMGWQEPGVSSSAELLADIVGDPALIEYIRKIKSFNEEEREKVFDYIDLVYYKKISKS